MKSFDERVDEWQSDLLDLANRNRLLNLPRASSRALILHIQEPGIDECFKHLYGDKSLILVGLPEESEDGQDIEIPSGTSENFALEDGQILSNQEVAQVIIENAPPHQIRLGVNQARTNRDQDRTDAILEKLRRQAASSELEQGVNILFATFGILKWKEAPSSTEMRSAPLVLLPIKIEKNARSQYSISMLDTNPEFNSTLSERLRRDFGIILDPSLEREDLELSVILAEVEKAVESQNGWSVQQDVCIGAFQFHKLRMFKDLSEHRELARNHRIVQALAFEDVDAGELPLDLPGIEELDRKVSPTKAFSVLDTDSSQLRAIQAAVRGANMIIEGPPGTGKSQTITNIIAECIASGKSVLFVSEKAAAIDVVFNRLAECNLDDFCLRLHSQKVKKADIIRELGERMSNEADSQNAFTHEHEFERLGEVREVLNGYVAALHEKWPPLGKSVFQVYGTLVNLDSNLKHLQVDAPVKFHELSEQRISELQRVLSQVSRYQDVYSEGVSHPWWGLLMDRNPDIVLREELLQALTDIARDARSLLHNALSITSPLDLPTCETIPQLESLISISEALPTNSNVRGNWFDPNQISKLEFTASEGFARATELKTNADSLFENFDEEIIQFATQETMSSYDKSWLSRLFSSSFRDQRKQIGKLAKSNPPQSLNEEHSALQTAKRLRESSEWFKEHEAEFEASFGIRPTPAFKPEPQQWDMVVSALRDVAQSLPRLPDFASHPQFYSSISDAQTVLSVRSMAASIAQSLDRLHQNLQLMKSCFSASAFAIHGAQLEDADLSNIGEWADYRLARFDDLERAIAAGSALASADRMNLGQTIAALMDNLIPSDDWIPTFQKLIYSRWLSAVQQADSRLHSFALQDHEQLIAEFQKLDEKTIGRSSLRVRASSRRHHFPVSNVAIGEPGILNREHSKRRGHKSLRTLFTQIPNLLPSLKPCLMMSPLSVAQYLSAGSYEFDIVLFDEASQVRPGEAVGAIMRGKQLVVAGDTKQLPPTSFFDRVQEEADPDDEGSHRDYDSILEILQARGVKSFPLNWHYRSRSEDLIAFSNKHFYDGNLITFPSSASEKLPDRGVHFHFVEDGCYDDERDQVLRTPIKVNRVEAREVAKLVMRHARARSFESLGVAAFNIRQRDAIQEEIDNLRKLDQGVDDFFENHRNEPFFVKALEEVQGDERDVILISVGYGKDRFGRFSHHFGPLNRDGGERRLNVLVTRAKNQIIVASSIKESDIDESRTSRIGPRRLKQYLSYAENGPERLEVTSSDDEEYESPFEEAVGNALINAGYEIRRQVGCSGYRIDLGVIDPRNRQRFIVGIECDGATYHSAKTARDRDRLRQHVLEGLGWQIHRVWSTEWMRSPQHELDRIIARINRELERADTHPATNVEPPVWENQSANQSFDSDPRRQDGGQPDARRAQLTRRDRDVQLVAAPYLPAKLNVYGDLLAAPLSEIARQATHCVEQEGPIHKELVIRNLSRAWGNRRSGNQIHARLSQGIHRAIVLGNIAERGDFLWPKGLSTVQPRGEYPDGSTRDIEYVPDEEILAAFRILLTAGHSIAREELITLSARYLGYRRTGANVRDRISHVLQEAQNGGVLLERNGMILLSKP